MLHEACVSTRMSTRVPGLHIDHRMNFLRSTLVFCFVCSCDVVRISVRLYFIMSERLLDATSILHCELEAPPV
jgi:hypothetical protein